jgi:hypothetical protein
MPVRENHSGLKVRCAPRVEDQPGMSKRFYEANAEGGPAALARRKYTVQEGGVRLIGNCWENKIVDIVDHLGPESLRRVRVEAANRLCDVCETHHEEGGFCALGSRREELLAYRW